MLYKLYSDSIHKPTSDKSLKKFVAGCSTLAGIEISEAIFGANDDLAKGASIVAGLLVGVSIVNYGSYRKKLKLYKKYNMSLDSFAEKVKKRVGDDIDISKENVINISGPIRYPNDISKAANNIKFVDDTQITEKFNLITKDYSCYFYKDADTSYDITDIVLKLVIDNKLLKL